ncbi:VWA domain-containing protein [Neotamlana laminarinivorans]|uniref:VWA domain-containing protein n=1 Tax=Neotamlana laminarinivorans TaxID=2883124 RepID=A0A9X1L4L2_9FLAO|nr:VWA domain-containing protein [Tamlana laminarinivorans]MCB4798446.1 VWA domain-containing protein [Tamlana laminarinivorans]
MKKLVLFLILVTTILRCSKTETRDPNAPFEDANDITTTTLETTIPRLEVSQSEGIITVMLSVTDQNGKPLEKFTLGNYLVKMSVNGNEFEVVSNNKIALSIFDELNNKPLAIATTMDYSSSMAESDILEMEQAMREFINLKSDIDLMSIIKFASYIDEVQPFTSDTSILIDAVDSEPTYIGTSTAFYSACDLGLEKATELNNALPIVIGFTDGLDNRSSINESQLISNSTALNTPIYTVGFGDANQTILQYLASQTGGRFFYTPTSDEINNLYQLISEQLRKLYVLEWVTNFPTSTEVTIEITTEYSAANGNFTDVSTKTITIE